MDVASFIADTRHHDNIAARKAQAATVWSAAAVSTGVPTTDVLPGVPAPFKPGTGAKNTVGCLPAIPPSVRRAIHAIQAVDAATTDTPLFSSDELATLPQTAVSQLWADLYEKSAPPLKAAGPRPSIPVSHAPHDNRQLQFTRRSAAVPAVSLPDCDNGPECVALELVGVAAPLKPYLSMSEQAAFDKTGYTVNGMCLLCTRAEIGTAARMVHAKMIQPPAGTKLAPPMPFYNTVDEPGGYKSTAVITPRMAYFLEGPVVNHVPTLLAYRESGVCPVTGEPLGYIDQSAIVFGSTPEQISLN
jgi:hypothetical protein